MLFNYTINNIPYLKNTLITRVTKRCGFTIAWKWTIFAKVLITVIADTGAVGTY